MDFSMLVMFRFKIWNAPSPETVLSKVLCYFCIWIHLTHDSYDIWIHIFRNLCNHSCPWLTILSTFGEALTLWLRKTLKEGWLKIINSPQELLCTPAPSDDALMSSIDKSNNKESSTAMLILFGPRLSRLCRWSEGTAASVAVSPAGGEDPTHSRRPP
jgi:hypothetical protein